MSSIEINHSSLKNPEQYEIFMDEFYFSEILHIFNEISLSVNKRDEINNILSSVLDKVLVITGMEKGGIYLLDRRTGDYVLTVHNNVSERFQKIHGRITREWKSFLPVIDEKKVVTVSDTLSHIPNGSPKRQESVVQEGFRSYVSIPIINEDSVDGILNVSSFSVKKFNEIQVKIFSIIGHQVGIAINQINLLNELRKSREIYFDLFEKASDVMYTCDFNGNILSINQEGLELLGFSREEMLGTHVGNYLTEESLETACALKKQVLESSDMAIPPILEVVRKDGSRLFMEFNIRPITENGIMVGFHGIARNVDRRLRAEQNLLVFTRAVNLTSDGIDISDKDHRVTFINEAGARMFGYNRMELIGQHVNLFYAEEDLSNLRENVIPSMEKYGYWNGLILGKKKDGTAFPVEVTLSSVKDDQGIPIVNIGVFRETKIK